MSEPIDPLWNEIEQGAGRPLVDPVDRAGVEVRRRDAYLSYESFLRDRLAELDRSRAPWERDYTTIEAYEASIAPMRRRLCQMLGFWVEPGERTPLNVGKREILLDETDFSASRFALEILPGVSMYAVE